MTYWPSWRSPHGFVTPQLHLTLDQVAPSGITYVGSARMPIAPGNAHFSAGGALIKDLTTDRLGMMSRLGHVVLLQTPTLVPYAGVLTDLPICGYDSVFNPPTSLSGAGFSNVVTDSDVPLLWSASIYYDANNTQRTGHNYAGVWRTVHDDHLQGHVAGWMVPIPSAKRAALGGDLLVGQAALPVITRTSLGPSAFIVTTTDFETPGVVQAIPRINYPNEHPTLGEYFGSALAFNQTVRVIGAAIVGNEIIFAGMAGLTGFCYGNGTTDPELHMMPSPDGSHYCYDPELPPDKGGHASSYRYQIWRYNIDEVLAADNPWDCVPIVEELPRVFPGDTRLVGACYDEPTSRFYVSQYDAENSGRAGQYPILHAFTVTPL